MKHSMYYIGSSQDVYRLIPPLKAGEAVGIELPILDNNQSYDYSIMLGAICFELATRKVGVQIEHPDERRDNYFVLTKDT